MCSSNITKGVWGLSDDRALLLSLKPRFANAILDSEKTVELRRIRPLIRVPTVALLYASSPTMALVGVCRVDTVRSGSPARIWSEFGPATGISRREFSDYFSGAASACALLLSKPIRFRMSVGLAELRRWWPDFQPPQSFRYVNPSDLPSELRRKAARVA